MLGLVTPVSRLATLSVRALVRMRLTGRTPSAANIEAGRTTLNGDVQGDGLGKAISLPKASGSRHGAHLLFLRRILRTACAQENHWSKPFQRHREQNELLLEQTVSIFHFAQTLVHLSAWLLRSLWLEKLFDSF